MSKIYAKYESLKKENDSIIYLFKCGIFYLFLDNDAKIMSSLLQLKLTNFTPSVMKCGFPVSSLEKYLPLLKQTGKTIQIIDTEKNIYCSPKEFVLTKEIKDFISFISLQDLNNFSIKEAYQFIDTVVSKCKDFLKEFNINE